MWQHLIFFSFCRHTTELFSMKTTCTNKRKMKKMKIWNHIFAASATIATQTEQDHLVHHIISWYNLHFVPMEIISFPIWKILGLLPLRYSICKNNTSMLCLPLGRVSTQHWNLIVKQIKVIHLRWFIPFARTTPACYVCPWGGSALSTAIQRYLHPLNDSPNSHQRSEGERKRNKWNLIVKKK